MWQGIVAMAQGKPDEAASSLDDAAKLRPDDVDILNYRGQARMQVLKKNNHHLYKVSRPHGEYTR